MCQPVVLSKQQAMEILPRRVSILLLDDVPELIPGRYCRF